MKYKIDRSFRVAAHLTPPMNRSLTPVVHGAMKNMNKCLCQMKGVTVQTQRIPAENGEIQVHIITPRDVQAPMTCLFYIHGGGFVFDAAPHHYKIAARYAEETGSIVVFPRYRLTPGFAFPTQISDCRAAYRWMLENAGRYGIDHSRIGIGGDSAGGFLAAQLTNWAVENGDSICCQLLIYQVIDADMRTDSMRDFVDTPMWNSRLNQIMWNWYYQRREDREPSLLDMPVPDLLPPSYVETAQYDCLHDEGVLYAKKLEAAGVQVCLNETLGTVHGYDSTPCEITDESIARRVAFIKQWSDK